MNKYDKEIVNTIATVFGLSKRTSCRFIDFLVCHGLHEALGSKVLNSDSKVYEMDINIPFVGVLTVKRDRDNNVLSSTMKLSNEFKDKTIRTMNGEDLLSSLLSESLVDNVKKRFNQIL